VADFTAGDNALPTTFQFTLSAGTASASGNSIVLTNAATIAGTNYSLISPIIFGTASTTGLATANQLNYNQTAVGILGFSVATTAQAETITNFDFSAAISTYAATVGTFFSNVKLYVSTTNSFAAATPVPAGYTVSSLTNASQTFSITGLSQSLATNTTLYYFIVADFTAPSNFSSTFALSVNDCVNPTPTTFTSGASITGTTYNCSPSVVLGTATTTGLAANPITTSATGIGIFGFSIATGPAYTFTTFNLYSTQPSGQYLGTDFSNYQLYVSTTNNFASATLVSGATFSAIASSNTLTISGLSQAIPAGKTYYYFIKANYTTPAVATTYELNLTSVATSSTTYTIGGPIYGTNYTLTGPQGVYYYTGKAASLNWEVANNWLNAYTGTASGWPGQSLNSDIAVFSPTYETFYESVITTTKTIGQIIVTANNTTPFEIAIKNGLTCSITNGVTLGDAGQLTNNGNDFSQLAFLEYSNNGTGIFYINGTSSLYNDGSAIAEANVVLSSGSTVNEYGTTADPVFFGIFTGGAVTGTNVNFNCTGPGSEIYGEGGTMALTSSTLTFGGFGAQIYAAGATMTLTGCTVNATGTSNTNQITGIGVSAGGTLTATGATVINLGTTSSNGSFTDVLMDGGTFNLSGGSTLNAIGNSAFIEEAPASGLPAINVNASTINLGTSAGSDGVSSDIYNSGLFYLNASSFINMNGASTQITNTTSTNAGTTYNGIFVAASTSVINPTSTTGVIYNTLASNYFTLLSDANGSATIGTMGSGAKITGKYNVQRYLRGGAQYLRNYTLLSSPVNTNAYTSSQYNTIDLTYLGAQATIPTATPTTYYGAFIAGPGSGFGGGIHTIANPLMYLYQEDIAPGANYAKSFTDGKNVGVVSINTANSTIGTISTAAGIGTGSPSTPASLPGYDNSTGTLVPPGNGYILYYIDNDARTAAASVASVPNASNVTASGYINQGQVQLFMWGSRSGSLTDTYGIPGVRLPGITVIGNPYPSTLDLQQVYVDNSSAITPSLYQLDKTTEQFDAYNAATHASSTSLSSEYVASGLGFYIHVDSLGSTKAFYFQEDQKTPSTTAPVFPPVINYALATPNQTADNVNTAAPGKTTDNVNLAADNSGVKTTTDASGATVTSTLNKLAGMGITNVSLQSSNGGLLGSRDTTKFVAHALTPHPHDKIIIPAPKYAPETPQPAHKTLPPSIANPAGLHLKFVVDSTDNDEIGVYFNKAWSDKYDNNDVFDMDGNSGKVYLSSYTSDDIRTAINSLGDYKGGKRVKLYVKSATAGIFQLQMTDIANFNTNKYSVFLIDNLLKDSLDLTLYKSYNFNYGPGTANDSTRFVLAIEHKPIPHYALVAFAGAKVTAGVQLNWTTLNEANSTTFILQKLSANNTYVFLDSLQSDSSGAYAFVDQHPVLGNNTYRLQQTDGLGNITYSAPVTIGYNSSSPNGGLVVYPNPTRSTMTVTLSTSSIATQVATVDIYDLSGTQVEHKTVNSNSFVYDASAYKLGIYIIELKNSNGVLIGKSKFVKVQ
jgi:hypothetical protein